MRTTSTMALLAAALAAVCGLARAQHDDGDPRSGPAAPSTIPGQGDSTARVPTVHPAPTPMPAPRKRTPGAQASPWGGGAPMTPAAPPVASQPPAASTPPVARGDTGTPPTAQTGKPPAGPVVVTPGQNIPPPSQPQAGANDRLTAAYRGLGTGSSAVVRAGGGGSVDGSTQRVAAPALACAQNGHIPKITRIRPANDASLHPGGAFIVEGVCFGDARGKVQVTLPTQYGRIQANDAQILDWAGDKILAQLPAGVTKATQGNATVEIASSAARGAGKDVAFEPRWDKIRLKNVEVSVSSCHVPNMSKAFHFCEADSRESGLVLHAAHYRGNPDTHPIRNGSDRYDLRMPPWMRLAGCGTSTTATAEYSSRDATTSTRYEGASVMVDWRFAENAGNDAFVSYDVECSVWVPSGLEAQ